MRPRLSLVVPLFDEEQRFAENADEIADFVASYASGSEVVFVDDGSNDKTAELVDDFIAGRRDVTVRIVRRPHLGKGAAVQAGLEAAQGDVLAFCDVDLSTPLDDLERIVDAAAAHAIVAIGSRDVATARLIRRQSVGRELLGKAYNRAVQLVVMPGISDTQCGSKAARRDVWTAVLPHCHERGFAWDVEMLAVARRIGFEVQEIAIGWRHDDRSRVRVSRDGLAMLIALLRVALHTRRVGVESAGINSGVFDDAQAATLVESDSDHWWFRSKAAIVASVLRHHRGRLRPDAVLCDVGAGAGGVTAQLGWPPEELVAIEGSHALLRRASGRHALLAVEAVGEHLPLRDGAADVVTLLDVIEHLEVPDASLREVHRVLSATGIVVITVPAYQWLWSGADEVLGHVRRYSRRTLRHDLEAGGFRVLQLSHVFSWLVVPVWLQRRLSNSASAQLGLQRRSLLMDRVALLFTRLEDTIIHRRSIPFGTSILAVASKAEPAR